MLRNLAYIIDSRFRCVTSTRIDELRKSVADMMPNPVLTRNVSESDDNKLNKIWK